MTIQINNYSITINCENTTSITKVFSVSKAIAGQESYVSILSNEVDTVHCDNAGTPDGSDLGDTTTEISTQKGSVPLVEDPTGTSSPVAYKVVSSAGFTNTSNALTISTIAGTTSTQAPDAMTADNGSVLIETLIPKDGAYSYLETYGATNNGATTITIEVADATTDPIAAASYIYVYDAENVLQKLSISNVANSPFNNDTQFLSIYTVPAGDWVGTGNVEASAKLFTDLDIAFSYNKEMTVSKVLQGSQGTGGTDAPFLNGFADTYYVVYDTDGNCTNCDVINVNTNTNSTDTLTWSCSDNASYTCIGLEGATGTSIAWGSGNSDVETFFNTYDKAYISVTDGTITDSFSIVKLVQGGDNINVISSNPTVQLVQNTAGTVTYPSAPTTIEVFEGSTKYKYDSDLSLAGSFKITEDTLSPAGLSMSLSTPTDESDDFITVAISGNATDAQGYASYAVTFKKLNETVVNTGVTTTYSYSKSVQGDTGSTGSTGPSGANAISVSLLTDAQALTFDSTGTLTGLSSLALSTTVSNAPAGALYLFQHDKDNDGVYTDMGSAAVTSTYTFTHGITTPFTTFPIKVQLQEANGTLITEDIITIYSLQDPADGADSTIPGADGADAITVILSNEVHVVPADNDGTNPVLTGSGTTIAVFEGTTALTFKNTLATSSFTVTSSATNTLTAPALTGQNNTTCTQPDYSAYTGTSNAVNTFTITIQRADDTTLSATKVQSLSKALEGGVGGDAINAILTNETHNVPCDADGTNPDFTGSGGTMAVYQGTAPINAGFFIKNQDSSNATHSNKTLNNLNISVNMSTGLYSLSGDSWNTSVETFTIVATTTAGSIEKDYSVTKSFAGTDGTPAKTVVLSSSTNIIEFDNDADNTQPGTETLTATVSNSSSNVANNSLTTIPSDWGSTFVSSTASQTDGLWNGQATWTIVPPTDQTKYPGTFGITVDGLSDSTTIIKLVGGEDSTVPGDTGASAITMILSNENHTFIADATGVSSSTGGTIEVYSGDNNVTSDYTFTHTNNSDTGAITTTLISNTYAVSVNTAFSHGSVDFIATHNTTSTTITRRMSLSKLISNGSLSIQGDQLYSFENAADTTANPSDLVITFNSSNLNTDLANSTDAFIITGTFPNATNGVWFEDINGNNITNTIINGFSQGSDYAIVGTGGSQEGYIKVPYKHSENYPVKVYVNIDGLTDVISLHRIEGGEDSIVPGPSGSTPYYLYFSTGASSATVLSAWLTFNYGNNDLPGSSTFTNNSNLWSSSTISPSAGETIWATVAYAEVGSSPTFTDYSSPYIIGYNGTDGEGIPAYAAYITNNNGEIFKYSTPEVLSSFNGANEDLSNWDTLNWTGGNNISLNIAEHLSTDNIKIETGATKEYLTGLAAIQGGNTSYNPGTIERTWDTAQGGQYKVFFKVLVDNWKESDKLDFNINYEGIDNYINLSLGATGSCPSVPTIDETWAPNASVTKLDLTSSSISMKLAADQEWNNNSNSNCKAIYTFDSGWIDVLAEFNFIGFDFNLTDSTTRAALFGVNLEYREITPSSITLTSNLTAGGAAQTHSTQWYKAGVTDSSSNTMTIYPQDVTGTLAISADLTETAVPYVSMTTNTEIVDLSDVTNAHVLVAQLESQDGTIFHFNSTGSLIEPTSIEVQAKLYDLYYGTEVSADDLLYEWSTKDPGGNWAIQTESTSSYTVNNVAETITQLQVKCKITVREGVAIIAGGYDSDTISITDLTDGADGADSTAVGPTGPSITYRGLWNADTNYIDGSIAPFITDVIKHSYSYYKCILTNNNNEPTGTTDNYWYILNSFDNVATDMLLTQDAYIHRALIVGPGPDADAVGTPSSNMGEGDFTDATIVVNHGDTVGDDTTVDQTVLGYNRSNNRVELSRRGFSYPVKIMERTMYGVPTTDQIDNQIFRTAGTPIFEYPSNTSTSHIIPNAYEAGSFDGRRMLTFEFKPEAMTEAIFSRIGSTLMLKIQDDTSGLWVYHNKETIAAAEPLTEVEGKLHIYIYYADNLLQMALTTYNNTSSEAANAESSVNSLKFTSRILPSYTDHLEIDTDKLRLYAASYRTDIPIGTEGGILNGYSPLLGTLTVYESDYNSYYNQTPEIGIIYNGCYSSNTFNEEVCPQETPEAICLTNDSCVPYQNNDSSYQITISKDVGASISWTTSIELAALIDADASITNDFTIRLNNIANRTEYLEITYADGSVDITEALTEFTGLDNSNNLYARMQLPGSNISNTIQITLYPDEILP